MTNISIVAHRGWWLDKNEKNSQIAFNRALQNGFGIETDIRDFDSKLVISHDIATKNSMTVDEFFENYKNSKANTMLALNIKSDCLCAELNKKIQQYNILNYFVFDMSIPDTLHYIKNNMNTYIRQSDIENNIHFQNKIQGFWVDEMEKEWINADEISKLLLINKPLAIVSSELHGRDYKNQWHEIKKHKSNLILLCTDYPQEALKFFI